MANTYLTRTPSSTTNRRTFTLSYWIKFSDANMTSAQRWFSAGNDGTGNLLKQEFFGGAGTRQIAFIDNNASSVGGSGNGVRLVTSREFRDCNGWYHIVYSVDTTQATSTNRVKFYVNGTQQTNFDVYNEQPAQNYDFNLNVSGQAIQFGRSYGFNSSTPNYFDGCMSHVHFIDGTAYDATAFGEYDANGVWKIKTSPSVTYGNNGFFILKDGNSVTDQSGNSNNFTVAGGTLTKTEDSPSNVFCTINPLDNYYGGGTFSNGNTKIQTGVAESYTTSTLGASSGKYYCEMKLVSSTATYKTRFGVAYEPTNSSSDWLGQRAVGWSYRETGRVTNNSSDYSGTWSSYTSGDIIGLAMDLDNNKLYFSKNGTWQNSGDPTSGATGTGGVTLTADKTYLIAIGDETGGYSVCEFNFGNGYFGTTAVSSAGTNASGNGIFEYDVPTGFTALSTKGLNL